MITLKPTDPGGRLTYLERIGGTDVEKVGTVWSEGPVPNSRWVLSDDEPDRIVCVKLPTKLRAERDKRRPEVIGDCSLRRQHDVIRRCDAVYRAGGVFGVVDRMVRYGGRNQGPEVSWHVDRACVDAQGKDPYEWRGRQATRPASQIIPMLLGETQATNRLCMRCVWLAEPGIAA